MRVSCIAKYMIIGAVVLSAGCGMMSGFYQKRPARFNHQVHVATAGLECSLCHAGLSEGKEPGMPDLEACRTCHGDDEAKYIKPFAPEGKPNWTSATKLSEEIKFQHARHTTAGVQCGVCHVGVEKSKAVSEDVRLDMDRCMACHADRRVSNDCAVCHARINQQWKPPSHERNWQKLHGKTVRDDSELNQNRCSLCHSESYCTDCHKNTRPEDHTNLWRLKTHGAVAAMDRERCVACHRTDFCRYCHMTTMPYTHTQAWMPPTALHCQNCHFPLEETNCYVCHKEAHTEGFSGGTDDGFTPVPPAVNPPPLPNNTLHRTVAETQCFNCHTLPPRHPQITTSCRNCHR